MGWGSFFTGLAADAAKDYLNKHSLDGMLEDDGIITAKEHSLLDKLVKSLNISPDRVAEIEKIMK